MTTATAPAAPQTPSSATKALVDIVLQRFRPDQRVVVTDLSWGDYEELLEWRDGDRRAVRLTYDRGRVELVTHGNLHERYKGLLGRVVSALCEELNVPMVLGGNCTIRREDLDRGFEPDDWFYLGPTATRMTAATATRGLDFRTDPPPDLAIEIEITRSLLDRVPLYAAVKIPELWRFDGSRFEVWILQASGEYAPSASSRHFPAVTASAISECLVDLAALDDAARLRRFREWVRSRRPVPAANPPTNPNT